MKPPQIEHRPRDAHGPPARPQVPELKFYQEQLQADGHSLPDSEHADICCLEIKQIPLERGPLDKGLLLEPRAGFCSWAWGHEQSLAHRPRCR